MGEFDGPEYAGYRDFCEQLGMDPPLTLTQWVRRLNAHGCDAVLFLYDREAERPWHTCLPNPEIEAGSLVGKWEGQSVAFGAPVLELAAALAWARMIGKLG